MDVACVSHKLFRHCQQINDNLATQGLRIYSCLSYNITQSISIVKKGRKKHHDSISKMQQCIEIRDDIWSLFFRHSNYLIYFLQYLVPSNSHLSITTACQHSLQQIDYRGKFSRFLIFRKIDTYISFQKAIQSLSVIWWYDHERMLFVDDLIENYSQRPNIWKIVHLSVYHQIGRAILSCSTASSIGGYF